MEAAGLVFLGICIVIGAFVVVSVRAAQLNRELVKKVFKYLVIGGIALAFVLIAGALLARAGDAADIARLVGPQFGIALFLLPLAMYLVGVLDRWRLRR